jgi:hypothetical protein
MTTKHYEGLEHLFYSNNDNNCVIRSNQNLEIKAKKMSTERVNFKTGTQPDFSIEETDGFFDINVPIVVKGSGTNDPSISSITGLAGMELYTFPGSGGGNSMKQAYGIIHLPHNYAFGTGIFFHTHTLTDASVVTGNFKINFSYTYASSDGVFSPVQTVSVIDSYQSTLQHKITETQVPLLANELEVDGCIIVRMWRDNSDPEDTFNGDIHLMFIDAHIQINKFSTKYRNKATTGSFYE